MTALRKLVLALALPALPLFVGCQGPVDGSEADAPVLGESEAALTVCPSPALNQTAACDLGDGTVQFSVRLPTGQQYVEAFARQNGIQNVALDITKTAKVSFDGSTVYAFARAGYHDGDRIEYRFYSYLPASPGVFTPGPAEQVWVTYDHHASHALSLPVTKDASLILSSYSTGPSADKNFGSAPTVDVASYHHDSRGLFGYGLSSLGDSTLVKKAELVIPAMWAASGNLGSFTLNKVNDSKSWQESTVTWLTTPAATKFADFTVDASIENRLDVTALVKDAQLRGESEISFLLLDLQNNMFIDSKEKASGKPTYLSVEVADVSWSNLLRTWHVHPEGSGGDVLQLVPLDTPVPGAGHHDEFTFDANGGFAQKVIAVNGGIYTFGGSYTRSGTKLSAWYYEPFRHKTYRYEYEILELTPSSLRLRTLSFVTE